MIDYDPDECERFCAAWRVVMDTRRNVAAAQGADYAAEWSRQLADELADPETLIPARDVTLSRGGDAG
ncbi:hypothetical protein EHM76_04785, partial [bacterium]